MRIHVLGPVDVRRDGVRLDLGSPQRRAVLALLAVARGQRLPFSGLADALWGERPPASAANVIQTHIKHLRRLLEPGRPARAPSVVLPRLGDGYALRVPYDAIDLLRFRDLVASAETARRDGDQERAAVLLADALALWQQPPLADLPFLAAHPTVVALAGERRGTIAQYGDVMLAAGRGADVLPVLEEAAVAQPLDEDAQARLIRAYEAVGRRDRAVAVYRRSRRRLADELGVDPGPELSGAYAALLRSHPVPAATTTTTATATASADGHTPERRPGPAPAPAPTAVPLPAQLPADVPDFSGRDAELAALDRLLTGTEVSPTAVAVTVVSGTAGVGKTALAVHWAHRTRHRFPDGQLYVNLRGYDPDRPMPPGDALTRFLTVLGVPGDAIPLDVDERASRYRSETAGRRMLVVLDNALSEEQVRPLLPGSSSCAVVVTSRNSLVGLVALNGARRVTLSPLPMPEAVALLRTLVGPRAAAEPAATAALAEQCARLPLALRIAAELAGARPSPALAELVAELADQQRRLDLLDAGGDRRAAVEAVFSWSYQRLPAPAARTFRLLSLHPGPETDAFAVAALTPAPDASPPAAHGTSDASPSAVYGAPGASPSAVYGAPGASPSAVYGAPGASPSTARRASDASSPAAHGTPGASPSAVYGAPGAPLPTARRVSDASSPAAHGTSDASPSAAHGTFSASPSTARRASDASSPAAHGTPGAPPSAVYGAPGAPLPTARRVSDASSPAAYGTSDASLPTARRVSDAPPPTVRRASDASSPAVHGTPGASPSAAHRVS
ncbi:BTAD domain-containing putative transcriptional regulator, partial [Streptomyces spongiae]|uniref:BTAD domain-containing putative transcriptional regulator n=1 Tax=Streptomyces spongiae TaxID=565072 RepID=UPI001D13BF89